MPKKKTKIITIDYIAETIEDLAMMVNKGFTEHADRMDKIEGRLDNVESCMGLILEELRRTHDDVRQMRSRETLLQQDNTAHEADIQRLQARVSRLEQKAGLAAK
ncbi:MAG: hypothetical protein AAB539_03085 [Patescibacteria group bacterium]